MSKIIVIGAFLVLAQSLKLESQHEKIVYDPKTGNPLYETNDTPKKNDGPG